MLKPKLGIQDPKYVPLTPTLYSGVLQWNPRELSQLLVTVPHADTL